MLLRDLPVAIEPIYTPGPDEPSSWLVRPREVLYDLDNVQLGVLSGDECQRQFSDSTTSSSRHACQVAAHHCKPVSDTLIVENLGYQATVPP